MSTKPRELRDVSLCIFHHRETFYRLLSKSAFKAGFLLDKWLIYKRSVVVFRGKSDSEMVFHKLMQKSFYLEDELDMVDGHGDTDERVRPPPFAIAAAVALSAAGLA